MVALQDKQDSNNPSALSPLVAKTLAFTEAYKRHAGDPVALREAMCLRAQYPAILDDIRADDLFAGRRGKAWIAYVGTIWWAAYPSYLHGTKEEGKQGGYCYDFAAGEKLAKSAEDTRVLTELAAFWESACSAAHVRALWDDELRQYATGRSQIAGGSVGFTSAVDYDRLLQRGIPGLIADIEARRAQALAAGAPTAFLDGLRIALEVLIDVCRHYERQARGLAQAATSAEARERFETMAQTLAAIVERKPETLREAIQLMWLYDVLASAKHLEGPRLDVALGDFYARDLDAGRLDAEGALTQLLGLWKLFHENGETAVCRIVIGGVGRRNEAAADRFALAAIEATRRFRRVTPQLTLRICKGQNPELLRAGYVAIGEGCIFPMIYNDDVVIPGVAKCLNVPLADAVNYHPLGCGEYMIAPMSPSLLCTVWSIPQTVEAVLRNGLNGEGKRIGPETGDCSTFDTFDKLYDAFRKQVRFAARLGARTYQYICEAMPKDSAFLYVSLLSDDCLARGKSLLDGGVRYKGACIMGHGFTNAADALTAIRKLVYEEQRLTLAEIVAALDADFEGHENTRRLLLDAPKFGNDDAAADRMLVETWRAINAAADAAGKRAGLDFLTVSSVNPGGYGLGAACGATADGRKKGMPFAIGHGPTAGFDTSGLTALFNSVAKADPANGGAVTNFKLSRELFATSPDKVAALFGVFFAKGGQEASITVVNRDDLQAAMNAPEKYPHVLVRVGGWAARFIDLERAVQEDILRRTLY